MNFNVSLDGEFNFIVILKNYFFRILFCILPLLFSGCLGTRYLKKDQKLLYKQKIKGNQEISQERLSEFYAQEPNRRLIFLPFAPYVWFYQVGLNNYDVQEYEKEKEKVAEKFDKKIEKHEGKPRKIRRMEAKKTKKINRIERKIEEGNLLMRWGEPLAVYDSSISANTRDQMELFLQSKGFFLANVDFKTEISGKLVTVTYQVTENEPYIIDSLMLDVEDTAILSLLKENIDNSVLEIGDNYDQEKLTSERERITELLKNNGYYNFSRQYVLFEIDSTIGNKKVAINTVIKNPVNRSFHKVFVIDSVNFIMDADIKRSDERESSIYNGIKYKYYEKEYSRKILGRRIFIRPGEIYSRENTLATQRQLANLNNFKFINVNYDSSGSQFIANIFTSPLSRYQLSNEVGVNVTQGFPGPFYNMSFTKRNVFGGLENMELGGRIGIEGVASASNPDEIYRGLEAGANISFIFPQFILPVNQVTRVRLGKLNPKTRLRAGFNFTDRPEYNRAAFNLSTTYTWENRKRNRFSIAIADLNLINSKLDSVFQQRLETLQANGNNLINSFEPSYVSSIIFTANFNSNNYLTFSNNSSFLRILFESGGTTLNFVEPEILRDLSLEYYKYIKTSADFRKHIPINKKTNLAYKISGGVAIPYSTNKILPYEKYFFAGGSNSIRGWRPRRLGPGSYTPLDENGNLDLSFEQQAEILLETSIELRRKLIGIFHGAAFIDAGNVWSLREDLNRPGARFEFNDFFTEIAIAAGFGIRFDFSFLILRFDAGLKVYDPARPLDSRFILSEGFNEPPFQDTEENTDLEPIIFNIGIGYPF